jgi:predicted anti-sigma-YlaC factor YlaD
MAEHVSEYLNAYLDGQLGGWRQERIEQHLAGCPDCQAELAALRRLSQALQEAAFTPDFPSAERFTAQVMLRLPRQPAQPALRKTSNLGWWLAPAAILLAWAFVQAVFLLSTGVWTAGQAGLLGETAAWLAPKADGTGMLTGALQWLGVMPGGFTQQMAFFSESIGWNLLVQVVLEGGLGLLYLGWLVIWWLRRQQSVAGLAPMVD